MARGSKRKASAPAPAPAAERRKEWEALRLTGKRAQSGKLPGGGPRYTYEVVWKDGPNGTKYNNTFEPADCLVEFVADMRAVDDKLEAASQQAYHKPVQAANAAKEKAAQEKAAKLTALREKMLRKQRLQERREARGEPTSDDSDDDGEEESGEESEEDADLPTNSAELTAALLENLQELDRLGAAPADVAQEPATPQATQAAAVATTESCAGAKPKRQGPSRVWLAFDFKTNTCKLPHPQDKARICGKGLVARARARVGIVFIWRSTTPTSGLTFSPRAKSRRLQA